MVFRSAEAKLDSFDYAERMTAIKDIPVEVRQAGLRLPDPKPIANLHCHTFFSYNCYGYSPSNFAWLARQKALAVGAIVDFDVLDGVDEFHQSASILGLKGFAGLETRVFVPELADKVINSPGEPGIAYHMGVGFPTGNVNGSPAAFVKMLRSTSRTRNESLVGRVNEYLNPVVLDYERDVLSLTPNGNATERHICLAYARKAKKVFRSEEELAGFWAEKLGVEADQLELPEGVGLQNAIRAKTMKQGGVGYVQPDGGSFPALRDTNKFVLQAGGIPTITWLNGLTDGESDAEGLFDIHTASGAGALNIIPDRNFTPGVVDDKLKKLQEVIRVAQKRGMPVFVGTEMNSPGQKFCDDFGSAELSPFRNIFIDSAYIGYAHSIMQRYLKIGYLSDWADANFDNVFDKNEFFAQFGRGLKVANESKLEDYADKAEKLNPEQILELFTEDTIQR